MLIDGLPEHAAHVVLLQLGYQLLFLRLVGLLVHQSLLVVRQGLTLLLCGVGNLSGDILHVGYFWWPYHFIFQNVAAVTPTATAAILPLADGVFPLERSGREVQHAAVSAGMDAESELVKGSGVSQRRVDVDLDREVQLFVAGVCVEQNLTAIVQTLSEHIVGSVYQHTVLRPQADVQDWLDAERRPVH